MVFYMCKAQNKKDIYFRRIISSRNEYRSRDISANKLGRKNSIDSLTKPKMYNPTVGQPSALFAHDSKSCDQDGEFEVQMIIIAALCIIFGLIINLMGYKLFKFILFMTGFIICFFATYVLCALYLETKLNGSAREYKQQIYLALAFGAGVVGGILTLCLYYLGLFVLGACLGWFAGMALLPVFKAHIVYIVNNLWLPYSICAGLAILGGLLLLCIQKLFIILATSFIGAVMMINGLDYFVEKGRVMKYTVRLMQGEAINLPSCWYTWLVISFLPILCIVGIIVQYTKTSKGSDHRLASGRVLVVDAHQMYEMEDESARPLLTDCA